MADDPAKTKGDQADDGAAELAAQPDDQALAAEDKAIEAGNAEAAAKAQSQADAEAQRATDIDDIEVEPEPSTPEAEGTAAAKTGIDKAAADVLVQTGDTAGDDDGKRAGAAEPDAIERAGDAIEGAPQRRRRGRRGGSKSAAEREAAAEPAAKPARTARRPGEAAPVVRAQAKYVRTSARKARLVCDHIRGKSVDEARAILAYAPRAVARDWSKLLESAVANAEHNHELDGDELRILSVHADEGPTLKRFRPRAMGRATQIRKRTSHLSIALTPKE